MALPITISGIALATLANQIGPFYSSRGIPFVIGYNSTNVDLAAYSPGTADRTTAGNWAEVDSGGAPNFSNGTTPVMQCLVAEQRGDEVHIFNIGSDLSAGAAGNIRVYQYHLFDLLGQFGTGEWITVNEEVTNDTVVGHDDSLANATGDIKVRDDGIPVVVYQAVERNVMGTRYQTGNVSYRSGGTWSGNTRIDTTNNDHFCFRLLKGTSGPNQEMHILYIQDDGTNYNIFVRTLDAANALQTEADTGVNTLSASVNDYLGYGVTVHRVDAGAGEALCRLPYLDTGSDIAALEFVSETNPTSPDFSSSQISADAPGQPAGSAILVNLAAYGSTVVALFSKSTDNDLYEDDDGDADTWGTDTSVLTGTVNELSTAVYDVDGAHVQGWVVMDGTTFTYGEIDLTEPTFDELSDGIFPNNPSHIGPFEA